MSASTCSVRETRLGDKLIQKKYINFRQGHFPLTFQPRTAEICAGFRPVNNSNLEG
jgi:hypothetical protein